MIADFLETQVFRVIVTHSYTLLQMKEIASGKMSDALGLENGYSYLLLAARINPLAL